MTQTIILSAGGTGGHVFPAIATAQELQQRGHKVLLLTDERTANYNFPDGLEVHVLASKSPSGGLSGKVKGVLGLLKAVGQAATIMKKANPNVVVGFGGYPSFPAIAMAMARAIPIVLHEQNRYLGKANRMAAGRAKTIALSFPNTQGIRAQDDAKCIEIGNPARPEILALRALGYPSPKHGEPLELLIFAGSQGARMFSEVTPAAIGLLPEELRKRLRITQQCRAEDAAAVKADYETYGVQAEIKPFFDDMAERLKKAHLVLCRSGASTVTEMMVAGRPAIYVPLAIAADNHQTYNAQYMEENNAGWLLPSSQFESDALAARLEYCLNHTEVLEKTAQAAHNLAKVNAAGALAEAALNAEVKYKI